MTFVFQGIEPTEKVGFDEIETPEIQFDEKGEQLQIPEDKNEFVFQGIEGTQSEEKAKKVAKGLKFFGFEPKPETIAKIRHPVGVGLKGFAKGRLGTPGEILKFGQRLMGVEKPLKILPTTEDIGNMFEKLSGEEFNKENLSDEFIDRGTGFLGSIFSFGKALKGATLLKTFGRNLLAAFAPAGVSVATEKAKLPPWMQVASTLGTSFLTHRLTGKGLRDIERGLYQQARGMVGDTEVSANSLVNNAKKLISSLKKGGIEGSDKESLRKLKDILLSTKTKVKGKTVSVADLKNKIVSVDDLMTLKTKINEARGQLFAKDLGRTGVKAARRKLNNVSKLIDTTIQSYENPEFQKIYKQANQLHGGIAETTKMGKWLFKNKLLTGYAGILIKSLLPGGIIGKGAVVLGLAQTGKMLKALTKYPGYRKAYFQILKNAAKEEARATASSVKKFNKKTKELLPEITED